MTTTTGRQPLTDEQLGEIEAHDYRRDRNGAAAYRQSDLAVQDVPALLAEVKRLRAVQEAVRGQHPRRTDQKVGPIPGAYLRPYCGTCMTTYPCPTIRALDDETDR